VVASGSPAESWLWVVVKPSGFVDAVLRPIASLVRVVTRSSASVTVRVLPLES
jgi:hypothetical protein